MNIKSASPLVCQRNVKHYVCAVHCLHLITDITADIYGSLIGNPELTRGLIDNAIWFTSARPSQAVQAELLIRGAKVEHFSLETFDFSSSDGIFAYLVPSWSHNASSLLSITASHPFRHNFVRGCLAFRREYSDLVVKNPRLTRASFWRKIDHPDLNS